MCGTTAASSSLLACVAWFNSVSERVEVEVLEERDHGREGKSLSLCVCVCKCGSCMSA